MNLRKWDKSWILVLGSSFLVAGLVLYVGYLSLLYEPSQEKAQTTEAVRTVSAKITSNAEGETSGGKTGNVLTKSGERPEVDVGQTILGEKKATLNSADLSEAESGLNIADFPSPVQGKVLRGIGNYYSEPFDHYLFHGGIDYAEPEGAIIRVTHGGKVVFAGQDPILGQKVTLDCGGGWMVTYGGLENLSVNSGDNIGTMDKIGQVGFFSGAEGLGNQPQLHYEVWHSDEVQRPA
ncbi:MAG: M23 family metallopeptidase [Bacillota bacterium]|nr:M23 family metallopeptidase [Bacillota bacterium]